MYWVSNGKQAHLGPENPDKGPRNRAVSTINPEDRQDRQGNVGKGMEEKHSGCNRGQNREKTGPTLEHEG